MFHLHIVPNTNTTIDPKSQTAADEQDKPFHTKSLTPQPHYEGKRKSRQDKAFNNRGEPPTRLDKQGANASVRQHLPLNWGGNRSENEFRMSNDPLQCSAKTLGGPLAARMEPLPAAAPPPQRNRRRKEKQPCNGVDEQAIQRQTQPHPAPATRCVYTIKETICLELEQRYAVACIALIYITLMRALDVSARLITPAEDDSNVEGIDAADNAPAVDDDKGKGVNLREYGSLMLNGSLLMGLFAQCIVKGPNVGTFHLHIVPKANTTICPKSQTAGHHIVNVDDSNINGADDNLDYSPRISREDKGKRVDIGECIVQGPNDETSIPHISPKTNTSIHSKSQTASDDGSEYMVPESSLIDDDDEATDQKVLAGTSTQADLSPAFGSYTSFLCAALQKLIKIRDNCRYVLLPVVPFVHHAVSCQLDSPHASATPTAIDSEGINNMDPDEKSLQRRRIGASGAAHHPDLPSHDGTGNGELAGRADEQPGSCAEGKVFTS
ncbi:hypothetical protein BU17DRAFT_97936 [Hysterangium stoloniferum]|nr:hypothetical protein BU17DRAFT_97936 [Hysterangium stoloniferum]